MRLVRRCGGPMLFSGPIQPPMLGAAVASARLHNDPSFAALQARARGADRSRLVGRRRGARYRSRARDRTPIFMVPCDSPAIVFSTVSRLRDARVLRLPERLPRRADEPAGHPVHDHAPQHSPRTSTPSSTRSRTRWRQRTTRHAPAATRRVARRSSDPQEGARLVPLVRTRDVRARVADERAVPGDRSSTGSASRPRDRFDAAATKNPRAPGAARARQGAAR